MPEQERPNQRHVEVIDVFSKRSMSGGWGETRVLRARWMVIDASSLRPTFPQTQQLDGGTEHQTNRLHFRTDQLVTPNSGHSGQIIDTRSINASLRICVLQEKVVWVEGDEKGVVKTSKRREWASGRHDTLVTSPHSLAEAPTAEKINPVVRSDKSLLKLDEA